MQLILFLTVFLFFPPSLGQEVNTNNLDVPCVFTTCGLCSVRSHCCWNKTAKSCVTRTADPKSVCLTTEKCPFIEEQTDVPWLIIGIAVGAFALVTFLLATIRCLQAYFAKTYRHHRATVKQRRVDREWANRSSFATEGVPKAPPPNPLLPPAPDKELPANSARSHAKLVVDEKGNTVKLPTHVQDAWVAREGREKRLQEWQEAHPDNDAEVDYREGYSMWHLTDKLEVTPLLFIPLDLPPRPTTLTSADYDFNFETPELAKIKARKNKQEPAPVDYSRRRSQVRFGTVAVAAEAEQDEEELEAVISTSQMNDEDVPVTETALHKVDSLTLRHPVLAGTPDTLPEEVEFLARESTEAPSAVGEPVMPHLDSMRPATSHTRRVSQSAVPDPRRQSVQGQLESVRPQKPAHPAHTAIDTAPRVTEAPLARPAPLLPLSTAPVVPVVEPLSAPPSLRDLLKPSGSNRIHPEPKPQSPPAQSQMELPAVLQTEEEPLPELAPEATAVVVTQEKAVKEKKDKVKEKKPKTKDKENKDKVATEDKKKRKKKDKAVDAVEPVPPAESSAAPVPTEPEFAPADITAPVIPPIAVPPQESLQLARVATSHRTKRGHHGEEEGAHVKLPEEVPLQHTGTQHELRPGTAAHRGSISAKKTKEEKERERQEQREQERRRKEEIERLRRQLYPGAEAADSLHRLENLAGVAKPTPDHAPEIRPTTGAGKRPAAPSLATAPSFLTRPKDSARRPSVDARRPSAVERPPAPEQPPIVQPSIPEVPDTPQEPAPKPPTPEPPPKPPTPEPPKPPPPPLPPRAMTPQAEEMDFGEDFERMVENVRVQESHLNHHVEELPAEDFETLLARQQAKLAEKAQRTETEEERRERERAAEELRQRRLREEEEREREEREAAERERAQRELWEAQQLRQKEEEEEQRQREEAERRAAALHRPTTAGGEDLFAKLRREQEEKRRRDLEEKQRRDAEAKRQAEELEAKRKEQEEAELEERRRAVEEAQMGLQSEAERQRAETEARRKADRERVLARVAERKRKEQEELEAQQREEKEKADREAAEKERERLEKEDRDRRHKERKHKDKDRDDDKEEEDRERRHHKHKDKDKEKEKDRDREEDKEDGERKHKHHKEHKEKDKDKDRAEEKEHKEHKEHKSKKDKKDKEKIEATVE